MGITKLPLSRELKDVSGGARKDATVRGGVEVSGFIDCDAAFVGACDRVGG